jgi:type IV pilus assembly protein PilB
MVPARVRLGELLVEAQIVSRAQLEEVLVAQKRDGRRIGTMLVEAGLVTETQVTQILSQQLSVPWVSLYHIDFSRQLLNLVSHQLAEKYCLVPIFVRRVRGLGETLYVAMDDPSDEAAQREVGQWAGLPVRAMIAPPTDIRSAIRVYYGVGKDTASLSEAVAEVDAENAAGVRSQDRAKSAPPRAVDDTPPSDERTPVPGTIHVLSPRDAPPLTVASVKPPVAEPAPASENPPAPEPAPAPKAEAKSPEPAAVKEIPSVENTPRIVPAPVAAASADGPASSSPVALSSRMAAPEVASATARASDGPDSGPQIEAREIAMPLPKKGGAKMITLTLLDGSKVNLPAREAAQRRAAGKRRSLPPTNAEGGELTARDLVAALRAVSHGADATEILGDNVHWEALFAALLSLLLKKHLIADWEFVEEYKKI